MVVGAFQAVPRSFSGVPRDLREVFGGLMGFSKALQRDSKNVRQALEALRVPFRGFLRFSRALHENS